MEFDLFLPFKIPLKMLKIFGFWQTKSSSWKYKIFGIMSHLLTIDLYTSLQFGYLFIFETADDFMNVMSLFPTCIALCFKSLNFIWKVDEVEELFDMLRVILKENEINEDFKNHLIRVDKIFKYFWASAVITSALGITVIFFQHELPYRMWFPYDIDTNEFGFWLSAVYQIIISCSVCGVVAVFDTMPIFFMSYILGMLDQLCTRLEDLKKRKILNTDGSVNEDQVKDNEKEFIKCIHYQLTILTFTRKVEKIFSAVLMAQGMMSSLILCTTAFALTIVSRFAYFSI